MPSGWIRMSNNFRSRDDWSVKGTARPVSRNQGRDSELNHGMRRIHGRGLAIDDLFFRVLPSFPWFNSGLRASADAGRSSHTTSCLCPV
jgi:hypothetical protein